MNIKAIKSQGMRIGLKEELGRQINLTKDRVTEQTPKYPEALENAKVVVAILKELVALGRERKPRRRKNENRCFMWFRL